MKAETTDLCVLGAGPAGMSAAIAAAEAGLAVLVVDDQDQPGGQVYRAPSLPRRIVDEDAQTGDALRAAFAASGAKLLAQHLVWGAAREPDGFRIDLLGPEGLATVQTPRLIVATGTTERVVPFPGWTLPGVIGLAAATVLLKAEATLPGKRTVVAGRGPLLYAVAAKILKLGGVVAAVIDQATMGEWTGALPALASNPGLLARGLAWRAQLLSKGVPVLHGEGLAAARGTDSVASIVTTSGRVFECDALAVGHGLIPSTDLTRLLRAEHHFDRARGGWVPARDAMLRTSLPGLYVAGDGGGVSGAAAAAPQGLLAGLAAALDSGRLAAGSRDAEFASLRAAGDNRFGAAMAGMFALRPEQAAAIPADCVVCRCEDVTRQEIDDAIDQGAGEINQVKAWTRCGMGPCQGRVCGDVVAELVAARVGSRERAGQYTARLPLRPLPMAELIGEFDYTDIPIPKPAPL